MSTLDELEASLARLRALLKNKRKNADHVATALTDAFLLWRRLAAEIGQNQGEFYAATPTASAGDAQPTAAPQIDHRTPLSALMESDGIIDAEIISEETWELVEDLRTGAIQDAAVLLQSRIQDAIRTARLVTCRAMIRHIWQGALNPWDMMKHALAITRRYATRNLQGISMTELALLLNETRAAPSARERRLHDALLIRWGVRGYKGDGALKSESACLKYREAAKGNHNRRNGERRKRRARQQAQQLSTTPPPQP